MGENFKKVVKRKSGEKFVGNGVYWGLHQVLKSHNSRKGSNQAK